MAGRKLGSGTFALQGHDPKSKVFYKNIMVKVLPLNSVVPCAEVPMCRSAEVLKCQSAESYPQPSHDAMNRRDFLRTTAATCRRRHAGAGVSVRPLAVLSSSSPT